MAARRLRDSGATHRMVAIGQHQSLRAAADLMVAENIGRLVVITEGAAPRMCGIITRSDLLEAHAQRLREGRERSRTIRWRGKAGAGSG